MITKTNKSLSEVFDIDPISGEVTNLPAQIETKSDVNDDFDVARTTMHNLLLKGQNTLEYAMTVANGTEDPKSFDSVSKLISVLTDATQKLVSLHEIKAKTKQAVKPAAEHEQTPGSTTNISGPVFVGSTSELAAFLSKNKQLK